MLKRILFTLLVLYTLLIGATFNGILQPTIRLIDAVIVGAVLVVWLWSRRQWRWYHTPLDGAILLWVAAFAVSLAANSDDWRKIGIGLWFVGLYVGAWYLLQDAFANRVLRREWLIDALLIAGVVNTIVGYAQVQYALTHQLELPRPVGTLGNPNFLAALLVMLLPLIAGRLLTAKTPLARVLLGVYGLAAVGMIGLSFSRGGWIAAIITLGVWAALSLPLLRWWKAMPLVVRGLVVLMALGGLAVGGYVIVQSLGIGGRGLEFRSWIYESAIRLFTQHPLTGTGLFTMGAGLAQLNSMPVYEPHSHAHNIILNVAAELGIVGLLALAWTAWVTLQAALRAKDPLAIMGVAAFAGMAVEQMFDMPIMMPVVALASIAMLVLAVPATTTVRRGRWQPTLIALGSAVIVVTGVWSALNYRAYVSAISDGLASRDYRTAAARLQTLADADPRMPIYPEERGLLLGLAASTGDIQAAKDGAASFATDVALAPNYTSGWANLAALQAQSGDLNGASASMQRVAQLAPLSWSLVYRAGDYAEAAGNVDAAGALYTQLMTLNPDVVLLPDWGATPLRRAIPIEESNLSAPARTLVLLERSDVSGAQQVWDTNPGGDSGVTSTFIVASILALTKQDRAEAEARLQGAYGALIPLNGPNDRAWIHIGTALLDNDRFAAEIEAAHKEIEVAPTASDWPLGVNIAYLQYLHLAIPRLFLPQVGYTESDPLLLHLLNHPAGLAALRAATAG